MNMFGHENVGPQRDVLLVAGIANALSKPFAPDFVAEERESLIARECDEMDVAGNIESFDALIQEVAIHIFLAYGDDVRL